MCGFITTGLLLHWDMAAQKSKNFPNFYNSEIFGISDYSQYFVIAFVYEPEFLLRTRLLQLQKKKQNAVCLTDMHCFAIQDHILCLFNFF